MSRICVNDHRVVNPVNARLLQTSKPSSPEIQTHRIVDPLLRKQVVQLASARYPSSLISQMHGAASGSLDTDRHSIGSINDACVLGNEARRACTFRCIAFLRKTKAEQISKRSHSSGPRNKMDARWPSARSFMSIWMRFMRP